MDQTQIDLLLTYGLPVVLALAGALYHFLVGKLPANRQDEIQAALAAVVRGVEQLYVQAPGSGPAKKAEAMKLAKAVLSNLGLKVSDDTLNVLIEAAVQAMNQDQQPATPAAPAPGGDQAESQPIPVGA